MRSYTVPRPAKPKKEEGDMGLFGEHSALLIADMIFDFVDPTGKLYVPGVESIVPYLKRLIGEARLAGVPVIYVNDAHEPR